MQSGILISCLHLYATGFHVSIHFVLLIHGFSFNKRLGTMRSALFFGGFNSGTYFIILIVAILIMVGLIVEAVQVELHGFSIHVTLLVLVSSPTMV